MLEHLVRRGAEAGLRRVTIVVESMHEQIRAHFGDGSQLGVDLDYVQQGPPQGTGHAVAALAGQVDGDFVLAAGDSLLDVADLNALAAAGELAVGGQHVEDARPYGLLQISNGRVAGIAEKPEQAIAGPINTGAYHATPELVQACQHLKPSPRGELELTDAIQDAALVPTTGWLEAGRPWDLLDMQAAIMAELEPRLDGDIGPNVEIIGPAHVAEGAIITGATRIEGPVWIGADAHIGPNAHLRPGTAIGPGCHVGNSCEIKNSILMAGTKVPHLSYVGDSILGEGCNLGAGTQVANLKNNDHPVRVHWQGETWVDTKRRKLGAIMGDSAKTGVNASLNPGTVLVPGATVPAGAAVAGWLEAYTDSGPASSCCGSTPL